VHDLKIARRSQPKENISTNPAQLTIFFYEVVGDNRVLSYRDGPDCRHEELLQQREQIRI